MRPCPVLLFLLPLAVACSGSRSDAPVLAAATIGPEGGVVAIDGGAQNGLRLTFPPGALAEPTAITIRDVSQNPPPGTYALTTVPPVALPFLIEPRGLRLEERAMLRAPYRVANLFDMAPGNVRARELRAGTAIEYEPTVVDVAGGFVELPIRYLSQYVVVRGPHATSFGSYWQVPGPVELEQGATFELLEPAPLSPFAGTTGAMRWRVALPGRDESLFFDGDGLRGRESDTDDWRELWPLSVPVWTRADELTPSAGVTQQIQVQRPRTAPAVQGQMTAFGVWSWAEPRLVGGTMVYDVLQLRISLAWNRVDLGGVGQREYMFWFAANHGLVGLSEDGLLYRRTSL